MEILKSRTYGINSCTEIIQNLAFSTVEKMPRNVKPSMSSLHEFQEIIVSIRQLTWTKYIYGFHNVWEPKRVANVMDAAAGRFVSPLQGNPQRFWRQERCVCRYSTLGSDSYSTSRLFTKITAVPQNAAVMVRQSALKSQSISFSVPIFRPKDRKSGLYDLHLSWFNPSCESCATQGKYCGLKANNTRLETECLGKINHFSWISAKVLATGTVLGLILIVLAGFVFYRIYSFDKIEKSYQLKIEKFLSDYKAFKPARYSYSDIKRITNEFKEELGQGAYGTVFKGKLSDQILVAVKVLNNSKGDGEEFVNEVRLIGRIHHVNVVRLIGFCADGFRRALIYEYLSNDSLEKYISSADSKTYFLGWKRMKDIVIGSAKGIEYLHQGCNQRIIHFDIKPNNILLDNNFNPKISDFGLAKLCSKDQSAVSMTTARGTIGYIAPEVFSRNFGNVSYKSDVYSFRMLVLEMVGGRKREKDEQIYFPEWIYSLLEEGEDVRLQIEEAEDAKIAKKLAIVGLCCIQWNPVDHPSMKTVVQMLEGEVDNLPVPPNPFSSMNPTRMNTINQRYINHNLEVI
ncbi:rust resistance kinase Lr10-like [Mercurialis annua]|uniref:rust resistance kinase Lr10-like n=1 Tax=Mercurialis annua TaxID=3986 RepID=UPI0024AF071F|nr:rust resistance kinase Lr10-like [Mercurialis annua]